MEKANLTQEKKHHKKLFFVNFTIQNILLA